jgi:tRNA pseudouridine13 synthase
MGDDEIPDSEADLGMEVFFTATRGVGGRLKRYPEDFVVDEISNPPPPMEGGRYVVAKVTATNWEMNRLVRQISRALGISRNLVHFAGTKDKRAVTSQLMTMEASADSVRSLQIHQVLIEDVYTSNKKLNIGDLKGNRFLVKVRDTTLKGEELTSEAMRTKLALDGLGGFPNYFGLQRFCSVRPITHLVGRQIVRNDMEGAVMWYVGNPNEDENEEAQEARRRLQETRDFEEAMYTFPPKLTFERTVIGYLVRNPGDYVGAIRVLPGNLQMMFVHAYQSFMFNRILSERIKRGLPLDRPLVGDVVLPADRNGLPDHDKYVPVTELNLDLVDKHVRDGRAFVSGVLFGQDSIFSSGEMGEIERSVVQAEGLKLQDFMVPEIPECNSRGSRRELLAQYKDLTVRSGEDELDVSFSLGKGCYATVLMREFMKSGMLDY